MKNKINNFIRSKFFIVILVLFFIVLITITGTYAWFTWSSTENTELTMTIDEFTDVVFTSGNDITTGLTPVFNYYDGKSTSFTITNRGTETFSYNVYLNVDSIDSKLVSEQVKYALVKNNELVTINNLSTVIIGTPINIYSSSITNSSDSFVFYLYIDGNEENDIDMIGKTITGSIVVAQ